MGVSWDKDLKLAFLYYVHLGEAIHNVLHNEGT